MAVTEVFRQYGTVFVKIRRDNKQMPFAFCQYTKIEHADRAIREGKGKLIRGRACRCEKAKAHRMFSFHIPPSHPPPFSPAHPAFRISHFTICHHEPIC